MLAEAVVAVVLQHLQEMVAPQVQGAVLVERRRTLRHHLRQLLEQ
jgi:hypothetical protein